MSNWNIVITVYVLNYEHDPMVQYDKNMDNDLSLTMKDHYQ